MSESITDKIRSIREAVGGSYIRPDPNKVQGFIEALGANLEATEYLKGRGLTPATVSHFKLGYCKELNAISIPIYKGSDLVNIKYRCLDNPKSKYLSEKGGEVWLFNDEGLKIASKDSALVVEGEFDCMMVWQSGIKNVVSPASGKDSFGAFLEDLSKKKRIYIAYDNDDGGKSSAFKLAERLGLEKCNEVLYPSPTKDANQFIQSGGNMLDIIKNSQPFTHRQFKGLGDIIQSLRAGDQSEVRSQFTPKVGFQDGWMAVISGRSNVGKTAYVLNIAYDIAKTGKGVLVLPFERGIESVGERLIQIIAEKGKYDLAKQGETAWELLTNRASSLPIYFAMPTKDQAVEYIEKGHRFFDIKVVIIDHLDYMIRNVGSNRGDAIMDTLQGLKRVAEDNGIILLVVSHIRKTEAPGQFIAKEKKPNIEDLKGSSSLYQDPEVVIMLSQTPESHILVDVLKNKGEMSYGIYDFNVTTGQFKPLDGSNIDTSVEDLWTNGFKE